VTTSNFFGSANAVEKEATAARKNVKRAIMVRNQNVALTMAFALGF
jgi:hypothetical protein